MKRNFAVIDFMSAEFREFDDKHKAVIFFDSLIKNVKEFSPEAECDAMLLCVKQQSRKGVVHNYICDYDFETFYVLDWQGEGFSSFNDFDKAYQFFKKIVEDNKRKFVFDKEVDLVGVLKEYNNID